MKAGLYDDEKRICDWDDLKIDLSKNYTMESYKTDKESAYSALKENTHIWSLPLYALFRYKEYLFGEMGW